MGTDPEKLFLRNVVLITYHIEKRYNIKNLFEWDQLSHDPAHILDRVLRSINIRVRPVPGGDRVRFSRSGRKKVLVGGLPVPDGDEYWALRKIGPRYHWHRQLRLAEMLEADAIQKAAPEVETALEGFQTLKRSNAVREDPVGPRRYVPPHLRKEPETVCKVCGSRMEPFLAQSRTEKYDRIGNSYWDCYGLSQTGRYTSKEIEEMFPDVFTKHRGLLAQKRWEECHPPRCIKNPRHTKYLNMYLAKKAKKTS